MLKMKKSLIIASLIVASIANAGYLKVEEVKSFNDMDFIKKVGVTIESIYDADSLYIANITVKGNDDTVYITKDKKYFIAGNVINLQTTKPLTAPVQDISIAKGKESFTFGTGTEEFYLFTDPECPYCKQFETYLPQLEKIAKINIFYFPLTNIHPIAKELSKFQLSQKGKHSVIDILNIGVASDSFINRKYEDKESTELDAKINEQLNIAKKFGIRSTPSLLNAKGERIDWTDFLTDHKIELKR